MADLTGYGGILTRVQTAAAECGRAGQVRLVAVSKAQGLERLQEAYADGCRLFGENYVQELISRMPGMPPVEWHFIGHLQTNKVKAILPYVALIHSVDRSSLVQEVNRRAGQLGKRQAILLEVNVGDEDSKSGVPVEQLESLAQEVLACAHLELRGLMCIPPPVEDAEEARGAFRLLRQLRDGLTQRFGCPLPELSMGMSGDFEVAIEEGATLVRVGTAIFGARAYRREADPGVQGPA